MDERETIKTYLEKLGYKKTYEQVFKDETKLETFSKSDLDIDLYPKTIKIWHKKTIILDFFYSDIKRVTFGKSFSDVDRMEFEIGDASYFRIY